jgi:ubiquinone/menaquinone biosynthesis C-methylase UbiE
MNQPQYHGRIRHSISIMENTPDATCLDIGCGNGWSHAHVAKSRHKCAVSLDINEQSIRELSKRNPECIVVVGSATQLPFRLKTFDLIACWDVIEHIKKEKEKDIFNEAQKCLGRTGYLLISTPASNILSNFLDPAWYIGHRHYSHAEIEAFSSKYYFNTLELYTRGNIWDLAATLLFYIDIHVFGSRTAWHKLLDRARDREYVKNEGRATLFGIFQKQIEEK